MSKELIIKENTEVTFESFKKNFRPACNEETLYIIYLIAIEEMSMRDTARVIGKAKQYVVDKYHKHLDTIKSIKKEYRLNELKRLRASKRDVFLSRATFLGAALSELEKRSSDLEELSRMPINKLISVINNLSELVDTKVMHKTSLKESNLVPDFKFETDIYVEEEG